MKNFSHWCVRAALMVLILACSAMAGVAHAGPGHWFEPDRPGHGLTITEAGPEGHGVTWFLHDQDGNPTFLAADNCPEFPCILTLYKTSAQFIGGNLQVGDPVGSLELRKQDDGRLRIKWNIVEWTWPRCEGSSPGGHIFLQCIGDRRLERLSE